MLMIGTNIYHSKILTTLTTVAAKMMSTLGTLGLGNQMGTDTMWVSIEHSMAIESIYYPETASANGRLARI